MRYFLLCALATSALHAQPDRPGAIDIGFKLGAPVNNPSSNPYTTQTQGRWTGGPTVELRLPFRFSLEVDALYRNSRTDTSYSFQTGAATNPYIARTTDNNDIWEFPILLKYHLHIGALHPFVSGGGYVSHESVNFTSRYTCAGPTGSCKPEASAPELFGGQGNFTRNPYGPVAGAGIEFRNRYMTITPEVRYSRPSTYPHENRFTALVGFTFGVRK